MIKTFSQKDPYDIKSVDEKLTLASQDLEHLNPYYTLSPIYNLSKFFITYQVLYQWDSQI